MAKRRKKKRSYRRKKARRACPKRCRRKCPMKRKRAKKFFGIGSDAWLVGVPLGLFAGYAAFKGTGL